MTKENSVNLINFSYDSGNMDFSKTSDESVSNVDFETTGPLEFEVTHNGVTKTMEINNLKKDGDDTVWMSVRVKSDDIEAWLDFFPRYANNPEAIEMIGELDRTYDRFLNSVQNKTFDCIIANVPALKDCQPDAFDMTEDFCTANQYECCLAVE